MNNLLNEFKVIKSYHGWEATTTYKDVNGFDYQITTMKRSSGMIATTAQAGQSKESTNGFDCFSFAMFQDPNIKLLSIKASATEKAIYNAHLEGLAKFDQLKESGELPKGDKVKDSNGLKIGTVAYCYGGMMVEHKGVVIAEPNQYNQQKCVSLSDYEPIYFTIDEYSRPIEKKFGIGTYYSESEELIDSDTIIEAVERANKALKAQQLEEIETKARNEADQDDLPKRYPHLTPLEAGGEFTKNLRVDLKLNFPKIKFSVKKSHHNCYYVKWTDGANKEEVEKITNKYTDHSTDFTGDYRDYDPSNFNRIFGGINYLFTSRDISDKASNIFLNWAQTMFNDNRTFHKDTVEHLAYSLADKCTVYDEFEIIDLCVDSGSYTPEVFYNTKEIKAQTIENTEIETLKSNGIEIINYSDKAIAVIGDTKPIKDKLKSLGGRFNFRLTHPTTGEKICGWIFPKSKMEEVSVIL
jgi:hypothetical protein